MVLELLIEGVCKDGDGDDVVECAVVEGDDVDDDDIEGVGAVVVIEGSEENEGESDVGVADGRDVGVRDGDIIGGRDGIRDGDGEALGADEESNIGGERGVGAGDEEGGLLGDDGGLGKNGRSKSLLCVGDTGC